MDIVRGSRRARHVTANAAAAAAEADEQEGGSLGVWRRQQPSWPESQSQSPSQSQPPQQQQTAALAVTTPGAPVIGLTHTPALQHGQQLAYQEAPPVRRQYPSQSHYRQRQQHPHQLQVTPDQPFQQNASPPGVAAAGPAPHPFRLHRTAQYAGTRLSMPYESDDSGSEPDMSVLATMRARHGGMDPQMQGINTGTYDEEAFSSQGQYEAEDSSMEERVDEEDDDEEGPEEEVEQEEAANLVDPADIGLKEISNLGRFTVSSHKPGNGIEELRSDDLKLYWQSDGPQPHKLTVYFVKRVGIRDIRFFVDYNDDESYTPTKIIFKSGTSENNLIEFATMTMDNPVGWQQVPIAGAGGEPDGNTLVSYVLQMQILENHQNGKDTHLRGIKIYAFDADAAQAGPGGGAPEDMADASFSKDGNERFNTGDKLGDIARTLAAARLEGGETGFTIPDFMREPEIR